MLKLIMEELKQNGIDEKQFININFENLINRELTTVSTISTISGGEAQLASHVNLITNLGIKKSDLEKVVNILNKEVDSDSSNRLKGVVEK